MMKTPLPEGAITVTLCFDSDFDFFLPAGRLRLPGFNTRWFTWAGCLLNSAVAGVRSAPETILMTRLGIRL